METLGPVRALAPAVPGAYSPLVGLLGLERRAGVGDVGARGRRDSAGVPDPGRADALGRPWRPAPDRRSAGRTGRATRAADRRGPRRRAARQLRDGQVRGSGAVDGYAGVPAPRAARGQERSEGGHEGEASRHHGSFPVDDRGERHRAERSVTPVTHPAPPDRNVSTQMQKMAVIGQRTRTTWRVRGPWTPSTRSSSMSLVADGPLIQVSGRAGSSRAIASGTSATTWPRVDDADVQVGHQRDRAPALVGLVVEDDRAGLGDPDARPGHDGVDPRRARSAVKPSSTTAPGTSSPSSGGTTARAGPSTRGDLRRQLVGSRSG